MIYEYKCECGKETEKNFPIGKREEVICECGETMKKKISTPKFMLMGEGWASKSRV